MAVLRGLHCDAPGLLLAVAEKYKQRASVRDDVPVNVLSGLPLVKQVLRSYANSSRPAERQQLLSILAVQFKQADLLKLNPLFTQWRVRQAVLHGMAWGVGRAPPAALKIVRQRVQLDLIRDAIAFVYDPKYVQQVAFGDRNHKLESSGKQIVISAVMRTMLRENIWEEYEAHYTDDRGKFHGKYVQLYRMTIDLLSTVLLPKPP